MDTSPYSDASLLDSVRRTCKTVAEQGIHVKISRGRLEEYAAELPGTGAAPPPIDPERHFMGRGEETAAFFIILDTINFGSGYFPHLKKRPGMSGYFTIASSLNDHFRKYGPIPPKELLTMTHNRIAEIMGQYPAREPVRELMQLFAEALSDLGRYILERFDGKYMGLIEASGNSAEELVRILKAMSFFNDIEQYDDYDVHFYKRAQLTAADLHLAFGGEGPGKFNDLHKLTMFADNLIPHVLRMEGILTYDEELARRIDTGGLISAGSKEEIELRACAVSAVELMVESVQKAGHPLTAMELDYMLWNAGQSPRYKKAKPRHRTRTVFY